ncbi:MAG: desampylase [Halolamina sp.]
MLSFSRRAYDEILAHAASGGDEEVCGVMAGERRDGGGQADADAHVEAVRRATNVANNPQTRYQMDPAEQLSIIEWIEERDREVVGFYHSHPTGPPVPSETDVERATWPGYFYAICVPGENPYLGSWRWTGEGFEREAVALRTEY